MSKDERQLQFQDKFIDAGGKGTFEACPAFGKTRVGVNLIRFLRRTHTERKVLVVVSQNYLKMQWESVLKEAGLMNNTSVEVINTAVKKKRFVDFLILDEIHRYAAETFSQVFEVVTYRFILGLTATIKRVDRKHGLLTTYCPVIDRVPIHEAKANGWIAEYVEYNLAVPAKKEELVEYHKMEETYEDHMGVFTWDFGLMKACALSFKPIYENKSGAPTWKDSRCARLAKEYGWKGNTAYTAWDKMVKKEKEIWGGNLSHPYHPKRLYIRAINALRLIRKMTEFVQNHPNKIVMAIEICRLLPVKTITFSMLTECADVITRQLPAEFVSYHSNVDPVEVGGKKLSKSKTLDYLVNLVHSGLRRGINTAKALDEGADFPEMQLGIRVAGTSSLTQHTQRRGRIVRKHGEKRAAMVNLYLPGTKEAQWLAKAQGHDTDVVWLDTLDELLDQIDL